MSIMHHRRTGSGRPTIVLVHGFACSLEDWNAQVADLSLAFDTVVIDLRGHGRTPGSPETCTIETFGADVAAIVHDLGIGPAVLVGHSMGCRVILEAQRVAPGCAAGLILIDGSRLGQPGAAADQAMRQYIETMGYATFAETFFRDMFLPTSDERLVENTVGRALELPADIGLSLMPAMARWDSTTFDAAVAAVKVPLLAIQSTAFNAERKRVALKSGETSPYLDLLMSRVADAHVAIVENVGHFPQLEASGEVNQLIRSFVSDRISARA